MPAKPERSNYIPVRLFDRDCNVQVGNGTLIRGADKPYVERLDKQP